MKEFLLSRSWVDERISLKWNLDWRSDSLLTIEAGLMKEFFLTIQYN